MIREIAQVREIVEYYTTNERLIQMLHIFDTQMNESFNMRVAEFAPKHKHYSRLYSLQHRVHHAIIIHNLGYISCYAELFSTLKLATCTVLDEWNRQREGKKIKKKVYDGQFETKRKRKYKLEEKNKEQLYLERSMTPKDGDYKVDGDRKKKWKKKQNDSDAPKPKRTRKPCDCGIRNMHFSSRYGLCARNKKNSKIANQDPTDETQPESVTCSIATDNQDISKLT